MSRSQSQLEACAPTDHDFHPKRTHKNDQKSTDQVTTVTALYCRKCGVTKGLPRD